MPNLVKELKDEHTDIIDSLLRVKMLKVCSDDGQRVLMDVKDMLLEHLKKEDDHLYPVLKKASGDDEKFAEQLKRFEEDTVEVTRLAEEFFDKYSADMPSLRKPCAPKSFGERIRRILGRGNSNSPESDFTKDFDNLFDTILIRVRKEESILYEAYKRLA